MIEKQNPAGKEGTDMAEGKKIFTLIGITLAVYLAIRCLLAYVIPFFIAYLLVHLLNPVTEKIRSKIPWKKSVIAAILLSLILTVCSFGFYYLYRVLMEQIQKVAMNFDQYYSGFCGILDECCLLAERTFGIHVDEVRRFVYTSLDDATEQIRVYMIPGVVNYSVRYLKKLCQAALFVMMVFVAVILLMCDYDEIKERLEPYRIYQHFHRITERMWQHGGMYLKAQTMIIGIICVICTIGLWIAGNPYFLLLGIVIGLTDALPFIGTGTALVPIAVVFMFQKRFKLAAWYFGLFALTYVVREFLEPRLIGEKLGIYPFVMVVAVYAGLYLYGAAGVILGPITLLIVKEIWNELKNENTTMNI